MRILAIGSLVVALAGQAFAQEGVVPIRVSDGATPRCISGEKDRVWLTLRRVIIDKKGGWLKEDKSIAIILSALVQTDPAANKPLAFPLMTEATVAGYSTGQVSIPIEYGIVNGFALNTKDGKYTGLQMDFTLLNIAQRNRWGNALTALSEVAKKLPLPPSPITQGATYLLDFANSAVTKDLAAQRTDDKVKTATLALKFDPTGKCESTEFETTGTVALLQGGQPKGDWFVPIDQTNEYCWTAELRPAFVLKAGKKKEGSCDGVQLRQVTNNYVAFFVNALPVTGLLSGDEAAVEEARRRCTAHGVETAQCLN